jgi:hypothetical protein
MVEESIEGKPIEVPSLALGEVPVFSNISEGAEMLEEMSPISMRKSVKSIQDVV